LRLRLVWLLEDRDGCAEEREGAALGVGGLGEHGDGGLGAGEWLRVRVRVASSAW
jgi:hypothetical protein